MSTMLSQHPRFTSRFVLRPFRRRDVSSVHDAVMASLPELSIWLPWAVEDYTRNITQQFIRDSLTAWNGDRAYDLTIRSRDNHEHHFGTISVWWTSKPHLTGEIGYWVRSDSTGEGICTETTARLLQIAFEELGMHRVSVRIAAGNLASERVAQKLGFVREGLLRDEVKVGSSWLDHTIWGLLDREWEITKHRHKPEGWA